MYLQLKNTIVKKVTNAGYPSGLNSLNYDTVTEGMRDAALFRAPENGRADWMVFIHGHCGHETQLFMRQDVKRVMLAAYLELGIGILSLNLRGNAWMNAEAVADLDAVLDYVRQEYGAERFFFESGSMGATSNLIYGALRPENVTGIVARGAVEDMAEYWRTCRDGEKANPMLGAIADSIEEAYGCTPFENRELYRRNSPLYNIDMLKNIPIYLLHGTEDELMPVAQSRKFAAAMGGNSRFVYAEIAGGCHDLPLSVPCMNDGIIKAPLKWVFEKADENHG